MKCEEEDEEDEVHSEEDEENMQRVWVKICASKKNESKSDFLFIGKVTKGKICMTLQMNMHMFSHWVT